ncbi:hypothetical protein ACWEQL_02945 [Kitasatospora sp. NPDC004240]
MADADFDRVSDSPKRRTIAELQRRIDENPIRKDLSTGRLVELVSECGDMAVVRPLWRPGGPFREVPVAMLTRRISDWA